LAEIAVVGAHCDDIAIGLGGTLLTMAANEPGLRVRALVLSGRGTPREDEELAALSAFCPNADVEIFDIPDGRASAHWGRIKNLLGDLRGRPLPKWFSALSVARRTKIEGDPFGGPVAMRLGVGGSWSTVGRIRLG